MPQTPHSRPAQRGAKFGRVKANAFVFSRDPTLGLHPHVRLGTQLVGEVKLMPFLQPIPPSIRHYFSVTSFNARRCPKSDMTITPREVNEIWLESAVKKHKAGILQAFARVRLPTRVALLLIRVAR